MFIYIYIVIQYTASYSYSYCIHIPVEPTTSWEGTQALNQTANASSEGTAGSIGIVGYNLSIVYGLIYSCVLTLILRHLDAYIIDYGLLRGAVKVPVTMGRHIPRYPNS